MKDLFKIFPKEVILIIWSFDDTYKKLYDICLRDVIRSVKIYKFYWEKGYNICFSKKLHNTM